MPKTGPGYVDFLFPLQKAIDERINGKILDKDGAVVPVFDTVPKDSIMPYVVIGEAESPTYAGSKTRAGLELLATLFIYTDEQDDRKGMELVSFIGNQVSFAILNQQLDLSADGLDVALSNQHSVSNSKLQDGLVIERLLKLRFIIMEVKPQTANEGA